MVISTTSEKLEVFDEPVFDNSVLSLHEHTYKPYGSPSYRNSDEVRIQVHFQDLMLDVADSYIYIEGKFTSSDPTKTCYLANNALAFLFEEIRYEMGGEQVAYLMGFAEDYTRGVLNVKQELIFTIARSFKNCYVGEVNANIEINKIEWKVRHIVPEDKQKLKLLSRLNKGNSKAYVKMAYRMWDLYELPTLRETSSDVWAIKTSNSLERPRYIIVGFQNTTHSDNIAMDATKFIDADVNNIRLYLNSVVFPYERWNLDFSKKLYSAAYYAYENFQKSFYGKDMSEPLMDFGGFLNNPLFVIDCSHQADALKSSTVDIKLEFETRKNKFPPNTKVLHSHYTTPLNVSLNYTLCRFKI
ncbi:hypothetical protein NQ318_009194 [Aromia moschata]|uniref:Double jelly roll-like domain-containing protein n=1 Tax=Aromia moschata TaxID=1265417 RepID=A0AAV8Y6K5_9CUCU|nr:hypothetical protein NQ318_009194 [Aromia moschata]